MSERVEAFWDALGALTFAELVDVAEIMRDSYDAADDFETSDVQDWSFLLNTAHETATAEAEEAR